MSYEQNDVTIVHIPRMRVASFHGFGTEPEMEALGQVDQPGLSRKRMSAIISHVACSASTTLIRRRAARTTATSTGWNWTRLKKSSQM